MRFAKWVFTIGGIYGLLTMLPLYFLETTMGKGALLAHPENYYGFIGVGVAWQVMFLIIARDPVRYRPAMLAGIIEKLSFGVAVAVLLMQHRIDPSLALFAGIDLLLAALFAVSWLKTAPGTASAPT